MTSFQKIFYQKSFYIWLLCILIFFSILLSSNKVVSDFWFIVLVIVFAIGVISFLAIFIKKPHFLLPLIFFQSKIKLIPKISKKMVITFSIVLTIFLLIYWFQLRPAQIKAFCQKETNEWHQKTFEHNDKDKDGFVSASVGDSIREGAKYFYQSCLHGNGL